MVSRSSVPRPAAGSVSDSVVVDVVSSGGSTGARAAARDERNSRTSITAIRRRAAKAAQPSRNRMGGSPQAGRMYTPEELKGPYPEPDRDGNECQCLGAKGKPVARRGRKVTGL